MPLKNGHFDEYARKIWQNDPCVRQDHIRWHTSGYHIKQKSLSIATAIEDAAECLDIIPQECGIDAQIDDWQERIMNEPGMIAVMAGFLWKKLRKYGRYAFDEEPDWEQEARRYLRRD